MRRLFCLFLAPSLISGCHASDAAVSGRTAVEEVRADVAAGGRGLATLNPHPKRAYRITLRINNAPGEFKYVKGGAQYDVVNEDECGSVHPMTGTASRITSQEDVALTRISATEYTGVVYADYMQDDDLYGRGTCRWEFTGANALLKATGAHEETRFLTFMDAAEVVAGRTYARYYTTLDYPKAALSAKYPYFPPRVNAPDMGAESPDTYRPEFRDQLFTITLDATEVAP